jgi:ferredoxin
MPLAARGLPGARYTLQVYAEDCTGCGLSVEACPAVAPGDASRKAINLALREPLVDGARRNTAFFETIPVNDRSQVDFGTVRGTQFLQPLFEFSGACAGCGETPYLKLVSQLFGDRLMIANATGCSSIYGGNLPPPRGPLGPGGSELAEAILTAPQRREAEYAARRDRDYSFGLASGRLGGCLKARGRSSGK